MTYIAHTPEMTEAENEARCRANELAQYRQMLDEKLQTLDSLYDQITRTEAAISVLQSEIEFLTVPDEDDQ